MMILKVVAIFQIFPILYGQLYFPDDEMPTFNRNPEQSPAFGQPLPPPNITALKQTPTLYEEYVDQIIAKGVLKLTLDIQKSLISSNPDHKENIVFAPVSISAALALILLGSNGKTFDEVTSIMGLATGVMDLKSRSQLVHEQFGRLIKKLEESSGIEVGRQAQFASAIFVQENYPIRSIYKQTAESIYESEVFNVDFQSRTENVEQIINAWVSERTNGKISQLLSEKPSSATKVILASAMYFKALWEYPFFEGGTRRLPFYTNGRKATSNVKVDMMANGGVFPYYKDTQLNCEIVGFPYKGNLTTMYVVVPKDSDIEKLKQLELQLTDADIQRIVENVQYTRLITVFPKMKIESTIDLRKTLQSLGLYSLFDPKQANLALLSPGPGASTESRAPIDLSVTNPISINTPGDDIVIFNRFGEAVNCTTIFDPNSEVKKCEQIVNGTKNPQTVTYKKFGNKVGRRVTRRISKISDSLDSIRQYLNQQANAEAFQNPGLYADNVIHKVYMDITESGTEAAASTSVSLTRDGGRVTVKVDVPFFFFILHERTKTLLFWGSVTTPTPSFS